MSKFNNNAKPKKMGKRTPITVTVFKKCFTSFADAIEDMKNSNDVVAKYLDTDEVTVEAVYSKICQLAVENMPNLTKRENMHWEFCIAGNNISVKTYEYTSFGWNVKSTKIDTDDQSVYNNTYTCRITIIGTNPEAINKLKENGWELEEKKNDKRIKPRAN